MIYFEDGFINYALHLHANSLYLFNKVGYYYIFNNQSTTNKVKKQLEMRCFLLYLQFIFENIKNNQSEKKIIKYFLKIYINNNKENKREVLAYLKINIQNLKRELSDNLKFYFSLNNSE